MPLCDQLAGSMTLKLMGQPLGSTGIMEPSTIPCAMVVAVASTQRGSYNTTEPTGSPIADAGIERPAFSISALLIVMLFVCANNELLINVKQITLSRVIDLIIIIGGGLQTQGSNVADFYKIYFSPPKLEPIYNQFLTKTFSDIITVTMHIVAKKGIFRLVVCFKHS
jgi:hypothetical protein